MKCMTVRLIATLLLIEVLTERVDINNYFQLINDVHKYYRTSCVIFLLSCNNHDLNMTTLMYMWSRQFSRQRVMTMTINFADLMSEYNKYQSTIVRPLFVVLLDTGETMSEFAKATSSTKPMSFPVWFVVFLQRPGNPLEKHCRHPIGNVFNVDFSTLMLVKCYDRPVLEEWYAIRDNRTRTFELATWSPSEGLILKTQKNLYDRRCDMFGEMMHVGSANESPLFSLKNDGTISGFLGLLLIELSRTMNFTMKILKPMKAYGSWNEKSNTWSGLIGQLVVGKADIGASDFTITSTRLNVVDFTVPLIYSQTGLYFKQPDNMDVHWSGYFQTFNFGIWIMIAMIIIIASILLTVMKMKKCFSVNLLIENYLRVWGIYCQQSLSEYPNESSMRLAFFSIYMSAFVISSAYSASLISHLTFTTDNLPFLTLQDYIKDGSYRLIVMKYSADYDIINNIKTPMNLKMLGLLEEKLPLTRSDGFKQICKRKNLAYIATELDISNITLQCKIVHINIREIDKLAMTLPKNSPYTAFLNYHLQRFQNNGIINKLKNQYFITFNQWETAHKAVSLGDIVPTLMIVTGGTILAVFIFIIEKACYIFNSL